MAIGLKRAVAAVLCAFLLAAPAPAKARVTVTVEVVYGGVLACGIGIFLYFGGSWQSPLVERARQGALLELGEGRTRLGVPLPSLGPAGDPVGGEPTHGELRLDLLRWRF